MLTKICEMHEMMKAMTVETKSYVDSKNIHFKEFMLIWPNNWEIVPENIKKMTDENTKKFLAKHGYSEYNSDDTKLSIRRKTNNVELVPTVNVSVSISKHANMDDLSETTAKPMIKAGYEIFDSCKNYNNRSFDWNLKIPKEVLPDFHLQEGIYQIQKYVLKNNIEFIITVTKIYENMLKKKPEILDEIASILQSFAIL